MAEVTINMERHLHNLSSLWTQYCILLITILLFQALGTEFAEFTQPEFKGPLPILLRLCNFRNSFEVLFS